MEACPAIWVLLILRRMNRRLWELCSWSQLKLLHRGNYTLLCVILKFNFPLTTSISFSGLWLFLIYRAREIWKPLAWRHFAIKKVSHFSNRFIFAIIARVLISISDAAWRLGKGPWQTQVEDGVQSYHHQPLAVTSSSKKSCLSSNSTSAQAWSPLSTCSTTSSM